MKRMILAAAALVAFAATAVAGAGTTASQALPVPGSWQTLTIRHEVVGCHSWSLNGGPYTLEQTMRLEVGQSLAVVNNDICTHTLLKSSGGELTLANVAPTAPLTHVQVMSLRDAEAIVPAKPVTAATEPGLMAAPGAGVKVTFNQVGSYTLTTRAGADYFEAPTIGPDNQIVVHVKVLPDYHHLLGE